MIFYVYFTCDYKTVYEDICAPVFLYSVSVFLAINNMKIQVKEKTAQKLAGLSKLTFGVYIIHVILLSVFRELLPYSEFSALYIIGSFMAVVCCSFLGAYVISKIPILKKLIKA
jgi:surface polysaccharide O-acyltransferase-like enzyme